MFSISVPIGVHVVEQPYELQRCPSYYAADWERLEVQPGQYVVSIIFETGYITPCPHYLHAQFKTIRQAGRLYSGFGGVNYSYNELTKGEEVPYSWHPYEYSLKSCVESGRTWLMPEWADWAVTLCAHPYDGEEAMAKKRALRDTLSWEWLEMLKAERERRIQVALPIERGPVARVQCKKCGLDIELQTAYVQAAPFKDGLCTQCSWDLVRDVHWAKMQKKHEEKER